MTWQETLSDIFAAYVNQQTLSQGAEMMAFVSEDNRDVHEEFTAAIDRGIEAVQAGDDKVISLINQSGYQVRNAESALEILTELKHVYRRQYHDATNEPPEAS